MLSVSADCGDNTEADRKKGGQELASRWRQVDVMALGLAVSSMSQGRTCYTTRQNTGVGPTLRAQLLAALTAMVRFLSLSLLYPVYTIKLVRRAGYMLAGQASLMFARRLLDVCLLFARSCKRRITDCTYKQTGLIKKQFRQTNKWW